MRTTALHTLPFHPPVSALQRRLWLSERYARDAPRYNLAYAWRVTGPFDPAAFRAAVEAVVARHEALRTTFTLRDGELVRVRHAVLPPDFTLVEGVEEADAGGHARAEALLRFDLEHGPVIRCRVLRHGPQEHTVLVTTHHAAVDGMSMAVVRRELGLLYGSLVRGVPDPLPPVAAQFDAFAAWQQHALDSGDLNGQFHYWKRQLAGISAPMDLPFLKPRPAVRDLAGRWEPLDCPPALTRAVRQLAAEARTSLSTVLMAAVAGWLGAETGAAEVLIGMSVSGRTLPEFDAVVGLCTNTLPLRVPVGAASTGADLTARTRAVMMDAQDHQDVPFPVLMQELRLPRELPVNPLSQVLVALRDGLGDPLDLPGAQTRALPAAVVTAGSDVIIELGPQPDGSVRGGLLYGPDLIEPAEAERLAGGLLTVLERMAGSAHGPLPRPVAGGGAAPAAVPEPVASPSTPPHRTPAADTGYDRDVRDRTARLWQHLLDVPSVSDQDDFFACGGDSLTGAELMLLLGDALGGRDLPLDLPLRAPTLAVMAREVTALLAEAA